MVIENYLNFIIKQLPYLKNNFKTFELGKYLKYVCVMYYKSMSIDKIIFL